MQSPTFPREAVEDRRKSYDSTSSTEEVEVDLLKGELQRSKTAQSQSETTSRSGSTSGSSTHRQAWALPFSLHRRKAKDQEIFEKSQEAAIERSKRRGLKKEQKRREKEERKKSRKEWPEHLEWFYGANMPGYWVI